MDEDVLVGLWVGLFEWDVEVNFPIYRGSNLVDFLLGFLEGVNAVW